MQILKLLLGDRVAQAHGVDRVDVELLLLIFHKYPVFLEKRLLLELLDAFLLSQELFLQRLHVAVKTLVLVDLLLVLLLVSFEHQIELLDLPLQLDGLLLGQLLLASEGLEVRLLDSPEGGLLELGLQGLDLVFQVLDPLALVVAQSEGLVIRLEFGDLLREVVDLFLDVLQLLLQLLPLKHGRPPHLIDFSLLALRLSEEDALLLKLKFPLILSLTEPQIILLRSSPRVCQVNLLDEFLGLYLVEVALVDRVPELLLQPLGRLRSIQTLPSHSLVVEILLLQLGLHVEDFLAGIC
jgi:hypothetical protein